MAIRKRINQSFDMRARTIVLLGLVHTALASIASTKKDSTISNDAKIVNSTVKQTISDNATEVAEKKAILNEININRLKTRRRKGKYRSTSSSSGEKGSKSSRRGDSSLDLSSDQSSANSKDANKKYVKYQNFEVRGWRRWHRKCPPCPEDIIMKWRDPEIKWICGGYQRARRSFKSMCMMHYRNCQDGTMFVKIHDHRCEDSTSLHKRGKHFFYDYKVDLPDDTHSADSSESSPDSTSSDSSKESMFG